MNTSRLGKNAMSASPVAKNVIVSMLKIDPWTKPGRVAESTNNNQGIFFLISPGSHTTTRGPFYTETTASRVKRAEIFKKLNKLKSLPENWDSYGAKTPNQTAIAAARTILERLVERGLFPSKIAASVENGVALRFNKEERYADIGCFNDGDIAAMYMDKNGVRGVFQIDLDDREIDRAIEQISAFING